MLTPTNRAMSILLQNGRQALGANYPALYFEFPVVDFSEWERNRENDEIATQTINFTALYDQANAKLISDCYVINNVASY